MASDARCRAKFEVLHPGGVFTSFKLREKAQTAAFMENCVAVSVLLANCDRCRYIEHELLHVLIRMAVWLGFYLHLI